jgi:hypothetical protein
MVSRIHQSRYVAALKSWLHLSNYLRSNIMARLCHPTKEGYISRSIERYTERYTTTTVPRESMEFSIFVPWQYHHTSNTFNTRHDRGTQCPQTPVETMDLYHMKQLLSYMTMSGLFNAYGVGNGAPLCSSHNPLYPPNWTKYVHCGLARQSDVQAAAPSTG